jgi:hypothetical protein
VLPVERPSQADPLQARARNADLWTEAEANGVFPEGGACVRLAEDRARGVVVAVTPDMDVFEFDGDAWREVEPEGIAPSARVCPAAAYDAAFGGVLVQGGAGSAGGDDDLWRWDGERWTQVDVRGCALPDAACPGPRARHARAFDPQRRTLWVHGGGEAALVGFERDSWRGLTADIPDRVDHAMVYDEDRDLLVIAGGFDDQGAPIDEILEVDPESGAVSSRGPLGIGGELHGVWDPTRRVVLFLGAQGGQLRLLRWDGATVEAFPTQNDPDDRVLPGFAYHRLSDTFVLHGGTFLGFDLPLSSFLLRDVDDAYRWRNAVGAGTIRPPRRVFPAVSHDAARGVTVLLGGHGPSELVVPDPTPWVFDGFGWRALTTVAARSGAAGVFVPGRGHLFFGGRNTQDLLDELLAFAEDTLVDSVLTPAGTPPGPRAQHGLAYDETEDTLVVFGGSTGAQADPFAPAPGSLLGDTFTLVDAGGLTWTAPAPAAAPSPRASFAMAWDPITERTLLFGGAVDDNGQLGLSDETWLYEIATNTWTLVSPADAPGPRQGAALALDRARGRLVLTGGLDDAGLPLDEVWEWDGADWREASPMPVPLAGLAAAGDRQGRVMTFAGGSPFQATGAIYRRAPGATRPSLVAFTSLDAALVPADQVDGLEVRATCGGRVGLDQPGAELVVWTVGGEDRLGAGGWRQVAANTSATPEPLQYSAGTDEERSTLFRRDGSILAWACRPLGRSVDPGAAVVNGRDGELRVSYLP